MVETTLKAKLAHTEAAAPIRQRRGKAASASGGLIILFALMLFGSALVIPSGQAIQEASMRDRLAAMNTERESQTSSTAPAASPSFPAILEQDDGDDDALDPSELELTEPPLKDTLGQEQRDAPSPVDEGEIESQPKRKAVPEHLHIPAVNIDSRIVPVTYNVVDFEGQRVREWEVAAYAAGHHKTSAHPGEGGNVVITGHNDWEGEVFRTLEYVELGDDVFVETADGIFHYVIEEVHMRREVNVALNERLATGQFLASMEDERITLVTCWPYGINDHRVIVVARPAGEQYFMESWPDPQGTQHPRIYTP